MNIAVIPNDYGIAHVTRSFEVAKALSQKGVHVTFILCDARLVDFKDELIKYKINHVDIPCLMPQENDSKSGVRQVLIFIRNSVKRFRFEKDLLSKLGIDAVVADFSFSSLLAAHECKIPSFLISNSYNLFIPIRDIYAKTWRKVIYLPFALIFFVFHTIFTSFLNTFPVIIIRPWKILSHWWYCFTCCKIIPEPESRLEKLLNPNVHHVGWIPVQQYEDLPFDIEKIKRVLKDRKLVYLTTGGTGFGKEVFLEIMKLLAKQEFYVIGSTGGRFQIEEDYSNYYVRDFLPGGKICEHVFLCINHGGQGSLMQAIMKGVYVIAFPQMSGQLVVSKQLLDGKNGKIVFTIEELKKTLKNLGKIERHIVPEDICVGGAVQAADIIIESIKLD